VASPPSADDNLLSSIRRHLDGLKSTRDGMVLYNLIERGLKRYGETGQIERAFVNFVTSLLGRYAKDATYDVSTRIKARLIQQRLALHLSAPAAPMPPASPAATPPVVPPTAPIASPPPPASTPPRSTPAPAQPVVATPPPEVVEPVNEATPVAVPDTDVPMETLERQLVDRVTETFASDGTLETPPQQGIPNALGEFEDLKSVLVKGLDELIRERHALIRRIEGATGYLKALEKDRRRLNDELSKARKHSSVDELTGFPKRDIFVRSLEAEVGRVRRYGFAFALALIDVDDMEQINQTYGRETGDAVLRCYAAEVLSSFRTYDLVARYGDDEFAVLFPNTQKEGAMHALEKAKKRASATYVTHAGRNIRLPSFSSVLAVYSQGEKPAQLLKRAAEALDNARVKGRDQIVVSLPSN
jgi:diguanylate cyclase (GGDEF)-like protein